MVGRFYSHQRTRADTMREPTSPDAVAEQDDLMESVRELQAMLAACPGDDARTADEIIGYDEFGLPS
jgi:hypothetical protein